MKKNLSKNLCRFLKDNNVMSYSVGCEIKCGNIEEVYNLFTTYFRKHHNFMELDKKWIAYLCDNVFQPYFINFLKRNKCADFYNEIRKEKGMCLPEDYNDIENLPFLFLETDRNRRKKLQELDFKWNKYITSKFKVRIKKEKGAWLC